MTCQQVMCLAQHITTQLPTRLPQSQHCWVNYTTLLYSKRRRRAYSPQPITNNAGCKSCFLSSSFLQSCFSLSSILTAGHRKHLSLYLIGREHLSLYLIQDGNTSPYTLSRTGTPLPIPYPGREHLSLYLIGRDQDLYPYVGPPCLPSLKNSRRNLVKICVLFLLLNKV